MKNLLTLSNLSVEQIKKIILFASKIKSGFFISYEGKKIATLFFENSTRTHYSFITAMHNLKITPVDVNIQTSSVNKGESLYDTVKLFESLGMDGVVIRHSENEYFKKLENIKIPIINGGDGTCNHPTQNLLDLMTIYEEFNRFEGLKICIVGDITHSRVAHGNIEVMRKLGMEVYISGPTEYIDNSCPYLDFDEAVKTCDIIMMLRIQLERHQSEMKITERDYRNLFGLTKNRVKLMKENAIIMHPAPFNRDLEIDSDVVEDQKSRIFKQMENGVYIRMAVISLALENDI